MLARRPRYLWPLERGRCISLAAVKRRRIDSFTLCEVRNTWSRMNNSKINYASLLPGDLALLLLATVRLLPVR